ncbi:MFS transporter [Candidatus Tisiphia endosymbiont of Nemotelus uliginosus]|uniref:MFS transporter n=1 Tax=Candidatus Tisiphia endosymbiont of Nemotelus uliginosus TaxID=3077926 RepID=UPI0035C92D07
MAHRNILLLLLLLITVSRAALELYIPLLPAISHYFNVSEIYTQCSITAYLIGMGGSQFIYGPLSERYGRKNIILLGLVIFIIGNILCVTAKSINILICSRLLTGIGGGVGFNMVRAVAADIFQGKELVKALSSITIALAITSMLVPLVSSYIAAYSSWHGSVISIVLHSSILCVIIFKYLPETNSNIKTVPLNLNSVCNNYFSLLLNKPFMLRVLISTLALSGIISYTQISPFLIIEGLGYSSKEYSVVSLFITTAYLISGYFMKVFLPKLSTTTILIIGTLLLISSGLFMLMLFLLKMYDIWSIIIPTMIYIMGANIIISHNNAEALSSFAAGYTSSIIGGVQMLGSALMSTLLIKFLPHGQLSLALIFGGLGLVLFVVVGFRILKTNRKYQHIDPPINKV